MFKHIYILLNIELNELATCTMALGPNGPIRQQNTSQNKEMNKNLRSISNYQ